MGDSSPVRPLTMFDATPPRTSLVAEYPASDSSGPFDGNSSDEDPCPPPLEHEASSEDDTETDVEDEKLEKMEPSQEAVATPTPTPQGTPKGGRVSIPRYSSGAYDTEEWTVTKRKDSKFELVAASTNETYLVRSGTGSPSSHCPTGTGKAAGFRAPRATLPECDESAGPRCVSVRSRLLAQGRLQRA